MPPIRVLVVDDAVVIRRIVTDALSADATLEVVGSASNGRIALAKIPQLNPDLITLDVEMPEMDGLQTLVEIRKAYPRLPVIMFSTLTERGTSVTMDALLKGANDYVTKPANVGSVAEAMDRVREQLVPKIHTLCGRGSPRSVPRPPTTGSLGSGWGSSTGGQPVVPPTRPRGPAAPVTALVIGVSTGGPNALNELLPSLPADLGVPVLIVQHMPPMFTRLLAERLDGRCPLQVSEAADGDQLRAGHILIAPGDFHLGVRRSGAGAVATITQGPPENSCRPAVDVLFRTASATFGAGTLAVVLTGMGHDGRRGSEHVREAGGSVIAQDQATSVVWGMPGSVVEAGLADEVLPLGQIAAAIRSRVGPAAHRLAARAEGVRR